MAVRVLNPEKTVDYILKSDRDSEAPTVFVLRPLTWEQAGEFMQAAPLTPQQAARIQAITSRAREEGRELTPDESEQINAIAPNGVELVLNTSRHYAVAIRHGLVEIRGLLDQTGAAMQVTPAEFARRGSPAMLEELANEILSMSVLSEDARKN